MVVNVESHKIASPITLSHYPVNPVILRSRRTRLLQNTIEKGKNAVNSSCSLPHNAFFPVGRGRES